MARNQAANLLFAGLGVGMVFAGGIRGWDNMQEADVLRGRDSSRIETIGHWIGDQKHVIAEILGANDGPPDPVDGTLFLTDLELAMCVAGGVIVAKNVKALGK